MDAGVAVMIKPKIENGIPMCDPMKCPSMHSGGCSHQARQSDWVCRPRIFEIVAENAKLQADARIGQLVRKWLSEDGTVSDLTQMIKGTMEALEKVRGKYVPENLRKDSILKVDGVTYRCSCGCNVFQKVRCNGLISEYRCNSCGNKVETESA